MSCFCGHCQNLTHDFRRVCSFLGQSGTYVYVLGFWLRTTHPGKRRIRLRCHFPSLLSEAEPQGSLSRWTCCLTAMNRLTRTALPSGNGRPNQTGIAASISQPSLSSSSARFGASSEATSMRRNLSPWLQYSLVNPITAGAPGCRQRHVDPAALIKQGRRSCKQLLILSRCLVLPWVAQTLKSMQLFRSDDNRTHQPPLRNGSAQGLRESPL